MQHKSGPPMEVEDELEIMDDSEEELTVVQSNIVRDYSRGTIEIKEENSDEMEAKWKLFLQKMGGFSRSETCSIAYQFAGPNGNCRICDLDFRSNVKTIDHIIKDHFDVVTGRKSGNQRYVSLNFN